jgi:NADH-quinone oxidoreductase subunit J
MIAVMIIFGVLTVIAAAGVVVAPKPLHSALFLVLTLFLVGVHYALLGAHFVAGIQVMVYAGAIMVLVIFVIMLLGLDAEQQEVRSWGERIAAGVIIGLFIGVLSVSFQTNNFKEQESLSTARVANTTVDGSIEAIGRVMFTDYLFPFEVTSMLILAGIIGAVVLGYEEKRPLKPGRGLSATRLKASSSEVEL